MYSTSAAYKLAIKSGHIKSRVELVITPVVGDAFTITDENILPGSLSINNRATSSGEFGYGSVYVGQLNVTLIDVDDVIDRYSLFGAQVSATFIQILSEHDEERIPLGIFYVNTPTRKKKTVSLECYDAMTDFDVQLTESTFGTPYELLSYLCMGCGVTLGNTQAGIEAMPNGTVQFTFAQYANMTARDALSNIAKVLCGFATIDRSGQLVIRPFSTSYSDDIKARSRVSSTIADYQTYFVAVTATMTVDGEQKSITKLTGREDGLVLDLGNIQIAQGTQEVMSAMMQSIASALAVVCYTPAQCEIISNPAYDLGDMVLLSDVNNTTDDVSTVITAIDWKYHAKMKITGDGRNALLNAVKSAEAKMIDNVANTINENAYAVKTYTNASQFNLGNVDTTIITINYSVNKDTTTIFIATIPIYMMLDGEVVFGYHLNNDPAEEVTVYLERGWHAVTLTNYFANESQSQNRLTVTCRTAYFESDKRIQDSKIFGLIDAVETGEYSPAEIDTRIPGATIPITSIKAVVFASGINTSESWDGVLLLIDEIGEVTLGASGIAVKPITDVSLVTTNNNTNYKAYIEQISSVTLGSSAITVQDIVDAVAIGRKVLFLTIDTSKATEYTYSQKYVGIVNNAFTMNEEYPSPSQYVAIDDGALKKCECDVSDITPSSMTIVATGEQGSGGGGTEWFRIPRAYQEVEYIECNGSEAQYIDTGFYPNQNSRVVMDVQFTENTWQSRPFGARGSSWNDRGFYLDGRSGSYEVGYGSNITVLGNISISNKTRVDINKRSITISVDGGSTYTGTSGSYTFTSPVTLVLLGLHTSNTVGLSARMMLYGCDVYDNDVLVRKFVPCYRKSDGVIGMYDTVNDVFYVNGGSGTFSKGTNVYHRVPTAYQEVEYIESTGTQYIDTEYKPNFNTKVEADVEVPASASNNCLLFGGRNVYGSQMFETGWNTSKEMSNDYGAYREFTQTAYDGRMLVVRDKEKLLVNGNLVSSVTGASDFTSPVNMTLFCWNQTAGVVASNGFKVYSCKVYDNGVPVRYFVPCYRKSDNVIGMYDLVSGTFFINAGTGTFTKGSDVVESAYKTLITDGTDVYSVFNGALTASVGLLANLDAQMFEDYGFDDLQDCVVAKSDVFALGEFSILRWCVDETETASTMLVTILGIPTNPQDILTPMFSITGSNVTGIELTTTDTEGNPQVAIKFDNGDWEYYDFTDEMWEEVGTGTIGYMTIADLESLTEEIWAEKFATASTMQTKLTLTGVNDTITLVQYKFLQEEE